MTRDDAIARAEAYFDSGAFRVDLERGDSDRELKP